MLDGIYFNSERDRYEAWVYDSEERVMKIKGWLNSEGAARADVFATWKRQMGLPLMIGMDYLNMVRGMSGEN